MREIVHIQAGQCGNQIGAKVCSLIYTGSRLMWSLQALLIKVSNDNNDRRILFSDL